MNNKSQYALWLTAFPDSIPGEAAGDCDFGFESQIPKPKSRNPESWIQPESESESIPNLESRIREWDSNPESRTAERDLSHVCIREIWYESSMTTAHCSVAGRHRFVSLLAHNCLNCSYSNQCIFEGSRAITPQMALADSANTSPLDSWVFAHPLEAELICALCG